MVQSWKIDKTLSLILLRFVYIFMWPLYPNPTEWATEVKGLFGQLAGHLHLSTLTHMHVHRDTHIIAPLWDRENVKATVNVKTCPTSKTHGLPFTPQRRSLFFPLQNLWRKHQAPRDICGATRTLKLPSPKGLFQSFYLFCSQQSLISFAPSKVQTQTKHIIYSMHQWHTSKKL